MPQQLIVVGFKNDRFKASEVLNKLRQMDRYWTVQLNDAVAAYRDNNGKLRIDQSYELTRGDGAAWGAIWGSLLGAALAIPFTGGASAVAATLAGVGLLTGGAAGAVTGALTADWWKEGFGISEGFVNDVGTMIQPGDSAIFAILYADRPEEVVNEFQGLGGKVLVTSLSDEQKEKIESVLNRKRN